MEIISQLNVKEVGKKPKIVTVYRCPKCPRNYDGSVYKEYKSL